MTTENSAALEPNGACVDCYYSKGIATPGQVQFAVITPNLFRCFHPEVIKHSTSYHIVGAANFQGSNCMIERANTGACKHQGIFFTPKNSQNDSAS